MYYENFSSDKARYKVKRAHHTLPRIASYFLPTAMWHTQKVPVDNNICQSGLHMNYSPTIRSLDYCSA